MTLSATVRYPRIDVAKTTDEIHAQMSEQVVEALKTFVFATTNIIPVWSGGTKASFLKLAALAKVSLAINPVAPSRVQLGIDTSVGEVFAERGKFYGFNWSSDLYYIGYVDSRIRFVEHGVAALRNVKLKLPPPIILHTA